jgi:hypothetical protein
VPAAFGKLRPTTKAIERFPDLPLRHPQASLEEQKALSQAAAEREGQTLSGFLRTAGLKAAKLGTG